MEEVRSQSGSYVDIDFGVDESVSGKYPKTILETLSSLDYKERHPKMDRLFPVVLYKQKGYLTNTADNINRFFERVSSQGCLLIEQENGPDEFIHDVRQDIFDRFKGLRDALREAGK